jgi:hypothetical protein
MQQPAQLKTLADLMAQAGHYAEYCLRKSGSMPPTLFLLGDAGPMMFVPQTMADESDKDAFANLARLVCIAQSATCCVMALEAWMKTAKDGEPLDTTEPPSQALDRKEVIVLMGEDRSGQMQKFLPIVRHDNGKFFNLVDSATASMDEMKGRFAQILSPKVPDKEAQALAKAMLGVKHAKVVRLEPRLRYRR